MKHRKERRSPGRLLIQGLCFVLAASFPLSAALAAAAPADAAPAAAAVETVPSPDPAAVAESTAAQESTDVLTEERAGTGGVSVSERNFPDPAFRGFVAESFDTDGSGVLSPQERSRVRRISCASRGISSLTGIHFFPDLEELYCDRNNIHQIDLSQNPNVTYLSFQQNPVSELDISACTRLQTLDMLTTSVASVDLTPCGDLTELTAGQQPLTKLDLSGNPKLQYLTVVDADIRSLDISRCSSLEMLMATGTWIASLNLGTNTQLPLIIVPDNYLVTLDLRNVPFCSWIEADHNYLVSVHGCPDTLYSQTGLSDQGTYQAAVSEQDGTFDFATIDPDFALGQVSNLSKGQLSGSILSGIRPGDTVTYTYTDGGLSVDASVHFGEGNCWLVGPSIHGWEAGQAPSAPIAEARYGTPVFTYGKPGGQFSTEPPTEAGTWVLRAEVPGTAGYGPLTQEVVFEVSAPDVTPKVPPLYAVHRTSLGNVALPDGFTWKDNGSTLLEGVGLKTFSAIYHFPNSTDTQTVPVTVVVFPKNGNLCHISSMTDIAQAQNVLVTDGTYILRKGKDYEVTVTEAGSLAVATVTFQGDYYGSVVRTFPLTAENEWTVPLSIRNWPEGTTPSAPVAQAKYGSPVFTYLVDGVWQSAPPTRAGQYVVRAVVPGTDLYPQISAEVSFRVLTGPPQLDALEATYGDILSSVDLPNGYTWEDPLQSVGNVGTREFAAMYAAQSDSEVGGPVQLTVTVQPKDGNLCDISPIRNEYESKNIVITDGNATLERGRDYFVSANVSGSDVTVVIDFAGNYFGSATRSFSFRETNSWLVPLSIENWVEGAAPNTPVADAAYGNPEFSYLVNGRWQPEPPAAAGIYTVRAQVPATDYYTALSAEIPFRVYEAADVPRYLTATYGDTLASVRLPSGYTWVTPGAAVGSVGSRLHAATWDPGDGRPAVSVGLPVEVAARNGALCTISPVTNSYEAGHITVTDGTALLVSGVDYFVTSSVSGNTVTVQISFIGNYYGTVERTFTFSFENAWVEPLSIEDWFEGQKPSRPAAAARYGTVTFRYAPASAPLEATPAVPETAGDYLVFADVAQTPYYNGLSAQAAFQILKQPTSVPAVPAIHATYGDLLSSLALPADFTWTEGSPQYVGNVGEYTYQAVYQPPDGGDPQRVPVSVTVLPRNGRLCRISPITDSYSASNIVITDGSVTLVKGRDYNVSTAAAGTTVTVTITFTGNYYGTVVSAFTLAGENSWTVPLSIKDWPEGTKPNAPVAQSRYGTPVFSYLVNGTWQSSPPETAGQYIVRAAVAATAYYPALTDEVSFRVLSGPPQLDALQAVYGDILSSVDLPEGYAWDDPMQSVGDAGTRSFPAIYTPQSDAEAGGPVQLTVKVQPKDGNLCTISSVRNEYESGNIVITDGNYTLVEGKDYYITTSVTGSTVSVVIQFTGNYASTATRFFSFRGANTWLVPLSIESWIEGTAPNAPVADSAYGRPVFSYLVGGVWQSEPPATAGSYTVRAEVAATDYYAALTAEMPFRIYQAAEIPQDLTAVYGSTLASVSLPEGYIWTSPGTPVGNVGTRTHSAQWTPSDGREPVAVGLQVEVMARNGALCTISPITSSYEAAHITISDGSVILAAGTDYFVTSSVRENTVTVRISFVGNYYGTVERTFTFSFENAWIEPLSIHGWFEGQTPEKPTAAARYGTVVFSYAPAASPQDVSAAAPEAAGSYIVFAEVAKTPYYNGLSAQASFEVAAVPADVPEIPAIHATYGTLLSSLPLPAGFTWAEDGPQYVGDVGEHTYRATYQSPEGGSPQPVPVSVIVTPRNGRLCRISPITDSYDASHIVITDGTRTLVKGQDYNVSVSVDGSKVTVTITFTGNYYGTVTESFTVSEENAWVVPPSIRNWTEGSAPEAPVAAARYGSPVFSYGVNGAWQSDPPSAAGEYILRAVVPASPYYAELTAEIPFRILQGVPQLTDLTAVYGDILASVALPSGYTWDNPAQPVGDAGIRTFSALFSSADPAQAGGPVQLSVTVEPKDGSLCSISPVTNGYDSRHIVIRDGDYTLVSGRDYYVSSSVEGSEATVTISFMGNYKGTAIRTFSFASENRWIVPLQLESWFWGDPANTPVADAAYGEPVFSYLVGGSWQEAAPTEPGLYTVRAVVPATAYYAELSAQVSFQIYEAPDGVYIPENLTAVYGSMLYAVPLPDGFAWTDPETLVGSVGTRVHAASYTTSAGTQEDIGLRVQVTPKDGALCSISPITNSYEARHITIRDGSATLLEGTDYLISGSVAQNVVTVRLTFIGNYTGSVTRTYTFSFENVWTEPLTLKGWAVGGTPNVPQAQARYGIPVFSFASAADPLNTSREVPADVGDYIVYADVPATVYYNGLSASAAFSITETPAPDGPELVAAPEYDVQMETLPGTGKVLTGDALMITRSGHTAGQVLPMADASPSSEGTIKEIAGDSGVLQSGDVVGTGDVMRLVNSGNAAEIYDEATIAVLGDVLGNGQMSIAQIVTMCHAITGARPLTGVYLLAGDFNGNGQIDIADLMKAALILRAEEL